MCPLYRSEFINTHRCPILMDTDEDRAESERIGFYPDAHRSLGMLGFYGFVGG